MKLNYCMNEDKNSNNSNSRSLVHLNKVVHRLRAQQSKPPTSVEGATQMIRLETTSSILMIWTFQMSLMLTWMRT
jgi:hypothetical protein